MYVNVGAQYNADKRDIPTKKALKDAIKADPTSVYLYDTSAFPGAVTNSGTVDMLGKGVKYSVTGPNPYTSRKWYATVEITQTGIIRVS